MRFLLILLSISRPAFGQMLIEKEVSLGRQMALEIESHQKIIHNAEVLAFTDGLLKKLAGGESLRVPVALRVIDNPDVMVASTLPGGIILISSGAILRSESEAELAALLAHAIAHSQIGQINRPTRPPGSTLPMVYVGGPWGSCDRSSDSPWRSAQASLTESQADLLALDYLVNAVYDPRSLVSVFERWNGKLPADEQQLRTKSDSLTRTAALAVVDAIHVRTSESTTGAASIFAQAPTYFIQVNYSLVSVPSALQVFRASCRPWWCRQLRTWFRRPS